MFTINDDLSIYVTRGDRLFFTVTASDNGKLYTFQPGDVVRLKVYGKKDAENVVLQKDFPVVNATEKVEIYLTEDETRIGGVISKPTDYWYEVELNPFDNPQTIIGYDEDGAKIFKLFPEGNELPEFVPDPEDIPVVDKALDMTSTRPVQNQAIARAVTRLEAAVNDAKAANTALASEVNTERSRLNNLVAVAAVPASGDTDCLEVVDIRVGADGMIYQTAGEAVREQFLDADKKLSVLGDFETDTSGWEPVNVIDGYSWGEAGYSYDTYGNIVSTEHTTQFTPLTQLVPAVPGATYETVRFLGQIRIYREDKTQIDQIYNTALSDQLTFVAPNDARYFGIYYRHDVLTTNELVTAMKILRTTMTTAERRACPMVVRNALFGKLVGKTVVNFGDSIFGNARPPEDISTYIASMTGATVHNCGFGGCRMSYHPYANYDAFSMIKLADAVANNNFALQDAAIANTDYESLPAYFAESVELLKSIDFNKVDIVTIAYGSNDFIGIPLDDISDPLNVRTFAGALRYSIETILTTYPHIRIFVCSPTYRFWMDGNHAFTEDSDTKMGGASYLTTDIVEKAKEVAKECKLPFIDNYYSLGINKFNRVRYFPENDGAHHNVSGRKLIAAHMANELF
jgi:lysophospholipase L1-like esterase